MTQPASKSYQRSQEEQIQSEFVRNKLKLRSLEVKNSFDKKYPHVNKFFADRGISLSKLREHSSKVIASGALSGALLFSPPNMATGIPNPVEMIKNLSYLNIGHESANSIPKNQLLFAIGL